MALKLPFVFEILATFCALELNICQRRLGWWLERLVVGAIAIVVAPVSVFDLLSKMHQKVSSALFCNLLFCYLIHSLQPPHQKTKGNGWFLSLGLLAYRMWSLIQPTLVSYAQWYKIVKIVHDFKIVKTSKFEHFWAHECKYFDWFLVK